MVLKPYIYGGEDDEAGRVGGGYEFVGGEEMLAAGRPLRINLDLLSHSARVAMQQGNASVGEALYRRCTQVRVRFRV